MPVGFIVEGHMEADIIKHLCRSAEIRRLRMNGRDVAIEKIAEIVSPQISLLFRKVDEIVIILDREQRKEFSATVERRILDEISERGIDKSKITVTCPDRNFESWIAPYVNDECIVCRTKQQDCEGKNGKSIIKKIYRKSNRSYVEIVDGVKLFKTVDPNQLRNDSASFRRFVERFRHDCWWLERS